MIKTLIVDDDLEYTKNIINNIINKIENLKIEYVCTNGKEALDIITRESIDLILLDLKMPEIDGFEVIERLKKLNMIKFPKIIVISGENPLIKDIQLGDNVFDVIVKTEDRDIIYKKIMQTVNGINYELTYNKVREKTISKLLDMGYSLKHKGTRYIIECIMYIYRTKWFWYVK